MVKQAKGISTASPGMCFRQSLAHTVAPRPVINFLVKTLYARITGINFQVRCLDRECLKIHIVKYQAIKASKNPQMFL